MRDNTEIRSQDLAGPALQPGGKNLASERNGTIELLRIVAACAVIWFHFDNAPLRRVGYAGLVFFLVTSVVFQRNTAARTSSNVFLRKRATRLLIPWGGWFLIYGLFNFLTNKPPFPYTSGIIQNILCGPWIGLWYLPFSLVSAIVVYSLVRKGSPGSDQLRFIVFASLSLLTLIAISLIRTSTAVVVPWAQWLQAAPSIPLGLGLAYASQAQHGSSKKIVIFQIGILITCACLYSIDPGTALSYGIGTLLVTCGLVLKRNMHAWVTKLGSLCLGAYLIHGAVMSGLKLIPWVPQHLGLWFIATTIISFVATAVVSRTPVLSKIV